MKELIQHLKDLFPPLLAIAIVGFVLVGLGDEKPDQSLDNTRKPDSVIKKDRVTKKSKDETKKDKVQNDDQSLNFQKKISFSIGKVKKIKSCLQKDCDYPDNDPREYSLSVYKDMSQKISTYRAFWIKNWRLFSDSQKSNILDFLKEDDGFVKKEMLDLLNTLPKDEASEHVDLVLDHVVDYHDSNLIPDALKFLKKTLNPNTEQTLSKRLSRAVSQGSPHVAQAVSKGVSSFISERTAQQYKDILKTLPEASPEKGQLSSALDEYNLEQSGG
jgi:hypothetical protein